MEKYSLVDHGRRACVTANPNMVTKSQTFAKSTWFLRKKNHKTKCCYVQNIVTCLWMFWKEFDGKTEEKLKDSLQLIWPLKYGTFFHTSVVLKLFWPLDRPNCRAVFHLFCRWRPVARASYQPRNAAVLKRKAQSAKNFRHWYFGLSNSCWTLFLRSCPRSLPFPHVLLHNSLKQLCWIYLVALRWKHYNLNIWRLMYQRIVVLHVNNSLQVVFAAKLIFGDDILARQHFVLINHVILRSYWSRSYELGHLCDFVTRCGNVSPCVEFNNV